MKQCPECSQKFDDQVQFCPIHGRRLETRNLDDGLIGSLIDGKYKILERIGGGGWGHVYKAIHIHFDKIYALKVLTNSWDTDADAIQRFRTKLASSRIEHHNVVRVTDFNITSDTGKAYLAMEFLEGTDLRKKLDYTRLMDFEESTEIIKQTCAGLEAAHSKNIIHRDLKPENIWLCNSLVGQIHVKVLDFGIARINDDTNNRVTRAGMIVGTPSYMSPEQVAGKKDIDGRSDVYSLGIVLYEMVTGKVPFTGDNPIAVAIKQSQEMPSPPRFLRPDLPDSVEGVILRSLEKEPANRQRCPSELAEELEKALYGNRTPSRETPMAPQRVASQPVSFNTAEAVKPVPSTEFKTTAMRSAHLPAQQAPVKTPSAETAMISSLRASAAIAPIQMPQPSQVLPPQVAVSSAITGEARAIIHAPAERGNPFIKVFVGIAVLLIIGCVVWFAFLSSPIDDPSRRSSSPPNPPQSPQIPQGMILIKGGEFWMGSNDRKPDSNNWPRHKVTVNSFLLDAYEVTNKQYSECVKKGSCSPPGNWVGSDFPSGQDNLPVIMVTWDEANKYAAFAGKRLPSEEEWEYAASGGKDSVYPWGNVWDAAKANSEESHSGIQPVTSYPEDRSSFGVFGMAGNVSEWVQDIIAPYKSGPSIDQKYQGNRVVRGGNWYRDRDVCQVIKRYSLKSTDSKPYIGFRCAKSTDAAR